jgi:hypothetical protein
MNLPLVGDKIDARSIIQGPRQLPRVESNELCTAAAQLAQVRRKRRHMLTLSMHTESGWPARFNAATCNLCSSSSEVKATGNSRSKDFSSCCRGTRVIRRGPGVSRLGSAPRCKLAETTGTSAAITQAPGSELLSWQNIFGSGKS